MKFIFTAITAAALSVVLLGSYWLYTTTSNFVGPRITMQGIPEIAAMNPIEFDRLQTIENQMLTLQSMLNPDNPSLSDAGLIAVPINSAGFTITKQESVKAERAFSPVPQRQVSLILLGQEAKAIVDGQLVGEGSLLPEGARVLSIIGKTVVIGEASGRQQIISLPDQSGVGALHPLRAGTKRGAN